MGTGNHTSHIKVLIFSPPSSGFTAAMQIRNTYPLEQAFYKGFFPSSGKRRAAIQ